MVRTGNLLKSTNEDFDRLPILFKMEGALIQNILTIRKGDGECANSVCIWGKFI